MNAALAQGIDPGTLSLSGGNTIAIFPLLNVIQHTAYYPGVDVDIA
jgi:hypothetical protein